MDGVGRPTFRKIRGPSATLGMTQEEERERGSVEEDRLIRGWGGSANIRKDPGFFAAL